ncbi:MAG TPA: flagellar biosynthetic protein FliQ [Lachnospiraceae bacterium]|nr:flagellar biosynthesis protein FliQ [Eubacterium sp.]HAK58076.1 flagellar biosynthetic protein FliQ [Lachnospiraceae bacterium]
MITDADILDIARDMIFTVIKCSMPLLLVSLIVGLVISIFQTITSIQEQTLTFVPKLLAIFLALLLLGGWIMGSCVEFLEEMCNSFARYV